MDMSGMGMGGMDMGGGSGHNMAGMTASGGIFTPSDMKIGRGFWYGVAGCVGVMVLIRIASTVQARQRLRRRQQDPQTIPSRPVGWISQAYATATATTREMLYPQPIYFTGKITKYFSPLPVGRWLLLAFYWIVILCFLWTDTILQPNDPMYAYKWEKVGFRAAWVTVTQIPFVYLLSSKFNPISILTGVSYERFNWLHRWVARTVFLTAIVHWSFFFKEWAIADFVAFEIEVMPMVQYGFGAWGIITWMVLTGFGFFRNANYELFVAQHIIAAVVLLWVVFVHVPTYAQYNVWMAVGFMVFDWSMRLVWGVLRNTHVLGRYGMKAPGYLARLQVLPGDVVRITIKDADFDWRAGQHTYISMPGLRPFELHPFTIANAPCENGQSRKQLSFVVQARSGFSRSLLKAAQKNAGRDRSYRTFISGTWGSPPDLSHYDTVVLIACSSGASFVVPLLQSIVNKKSCVRTATLHWIIRADEHFCWFGERLILLTEQAAALDLHLQIFVHVTRSTASCFDRGTESAKQSANVDTFALNSEESSSLSSRDSDLVEKPNNEQLNRAHDHPTLHRRYGGRPTLDSMIRPPVEQALGETAVVVCGGLPITAEARTYVAALSDERAVHKGTGAQGVMLYTETYGW